MCKNRTRKFSFSSFFVPAIEPPTALFGGSSADDNNRLNTGVRRTIREANCPPRRPVRLGFLEAVEPIASYVRPHCGCREWHRATSVGPFTQLAIGSVPAVTPALERLHPNATPWTPGRRTQPPRPSLRTPGISRSPPGICGGAFLPGSSGRWNFAISGIRKSCPCRRSTGTRLSRIKPFAPTLGVAAATPRMNPWRARLAIR